MSEARDRYYREKIGIDEIMGRLVTDYVEELEKKIEQYEQSSSADYDFAMDKIQANIIKQVYGVQTEPLAGQVKVTVEYLIPVKISRGPIKTKPIQGKPGIAFELSCDMEPYEKVKKHINDFIESENSEEITQ